MARDGAEDRRETIAGKAGTTQHGMRADWPLFAAAGPWSPMLGFLQAWNGSASATVTEFHVECIDFMNRRFKEDVKLQRRLAYCNSPEDIQSAMTDFCQKFGEDYQKEFTELVKLTTASVEEAAHHLEPAPLPRTADAA